jgi:hypothetical protein
MLIAVDAACAEHGPAAGALARPARGLIKWSGPDRSVPRETIMPGNPIKFRCYKCNQLLGVSRSKLGTVVACPKCATELQVPDPEDASASPPGSSSPAPAPIPETTSAFLSALEAGLPVEGSDSRVEIELEPEPELVLEPEPEAEPEPIPRIPPTRAPEPLPPPVLPEPELVPVRSPAQEFGAARNSVRPPAPVEPLVAGIRVEPPSLVSERTPVVRSRDLVLPRAVVAFWSLFVLLALILAFLAGLLSGHYVWRVH